MTETRYRVNAKSTTKGIWTLDVTVELPDSSLNRNIDESNSDIMEKNTIGEELLRIIKNTERAFVADGRRLAGDE